MPTLNRTNGALPEKETEQSRTNITNDTTSPRVGGEEKQYSVGDVTPHHNLLHTRSRATSNEIPLIVETVRYALVLPICRLGNLCRNRVTVPYALQYSRRLSVQW